MKKLKSIFLFTALLLLFNIASAQYTEVINSNRPGFSQSAFSIGTNVVQFEAGPFMVKEEHTPLNYDVSGFGADFAVRYGLFFEQLEVNLHGTYQNDTFTDNRSVIPEEFKRNNFKAIVLGAKYLIYDPYKNAEEEKPNLYSWKANRQFKWKSLIPAVAVYAGVNFDQERNPFLAPDVKGISPKIAIISQNNLAGGWVFVINLIKDRIGSDFYDFEYIVTLTKSVADQWVVFGETHGYKGDFYADNLFRLGGAYLWSRDFQVDTAVTFNTKDTPSVLNVTIGASYRLDFHEDDIDNNNSAEDEARRKSRKRNKKRKKKQDDFEDDSGN